jgi:serine protease Do
VGTRRRSAPSLSGPQWAGLGSFLVGVAAVLAVVWQPASPGATSSPPGPAASVTSAPPISPAPVAGASAGASVVRSLEALPDAVVRIEATGTFAEPHGVGPESVGYGSGFIVDPSGIVLTNSHIVTGAKTVTVWVGSEVTTQTAEVLGVSECSDLAAIRLSGRKNLPYLDWYEGPIERELPIYAAGYPRGGPNPKVTPGTVSGARGVTDKARLSVEDTIEIDVTIPAGSAGGPVVTNEGRVVAVTYPRDDMTKPPLAIRADKARKILQYLEAGQDFTSVGINGYAQKSHHDGIWVVAVKRDSPAARARILPGDVITDLDGTSMAVDGTMAEYCRVVGQYQGGDALPFTVYREESRATLKGVLNGKPVEPDFAFAVDVGKATPGPPQPWTTRSTESRGTLHVDAPPSWTQTLDHAWKFDDAWVGPGLLIAPNIKAFLKGFRMPGALVTASATLGRTTLAAVLDDKRYGLMHDHHCKLVGRAAFTRGGYEGIYDLWKSCEGEKSRFLTIAAKKADGSHIVYIQFQAPETADLAILDRILVTLEFDPAGN